MSEDVLVKAIEKYVANKNDSSFAVKIIKILALIYNEIDLVNPFLLKKYELIDQNLKRYGLSNESLVKFKNSFAKYLKDKDMDSFLTLYKIIIDMIVKKYQNSFISAEEVAMYEKYFFEGKSLKALNEYWDKALYKINNKIIFTEVNENIFNPYAYYLQGKTLADIKDMSEDKLYLLNKKILREYNIKMDDENMISKLNKALYKELYTPKFSTGNGFVDALMIVSFVATEIMVAFVAYVGFVLR